MMKEFRYLCVRPPGRKTRRSITCVIRPAVRLLEESFSFRQWGLRSGLCCRCLMVHNTVAGLEVLSFLVKGFYGFM